MQTRLVGETHGRVTFSRILPSTPLGEVRQEFSFQGEGQLLAVSFREVGTSVQIHRADGAMVAESSNVLLTTHEGQHAAITGMGIAVPIQGQPGALRAVGANLIATTAPCWQELTRGLLLVETTLDQQGGYRLKIWEWK